MTGFVTTIARTTPVLAWNECSRLGDMLSELRRERDNAAAQGHTHTVRVLNADIDAHQDALTTALAEYNAAR